MTEKSSFALFAALPLLDMLFQLRPVGMWSTILHAAICGAALYRIIKHLKPFGLTNAVMVVVAVVYNPFRTFQLGITGWITADVIVMALFYLMARNTPLAEPRQTQDEHPHDA